MSYEAKVFRILIASPSDVEDERDMVAAIIQSWNDLHSASRKIVLLPLRWETHSAPEFGVRPQDVINRAIVDDCDLLIGIFWTRIGSPTGVADSGTLEEIDRVGKAGKPVMLYFSRVPVDPEGIDLRQVEKLKEFKQNTYPQGLVESYRSISDFRDKLSRQIEIKVRELQTREKSGPSPVSFSFISSETRRPVGAQFNSKLFSYNPSDLSSVSQKEMPEVEKLIQRRRKIDLTTPIILALENTGSVALRNLFTEITISASHDEFALSSSGPASNYRQFLFYEGLLGQGESESEKATREILAEYQSDGFRELDGGWRLTMQWDAIQPQRIHLLKPPLYLTTEKPGTLSLKGKLYSDSLAEPYQFFGQIEVGVEERPVDLDEMIPDWKDQVKKNSGSTKVITPRFV